jgi:phosphoesterase RecJ-like protein
MEAGANLSELIARTLTHRPLAVMQLWGLALAQLQHAGRAVWCCVSEAMRAQAASPEDAESGLVSFLIGAPEANVAAVFSERPNHQVDVSMRARPGYDVSRLALSLGGGGHPQASGCTLPGALHEVEAQVAPLLIATADQRL